MRKLIVFLLVPLAVLAVSCHDVTIGSQTWQPQNVQTIVYRNGDSIPQVEDKNTWAALTTGAWCIYYSEGKLYGKLYNWYAVHDPRGLAPAGWHIPTDAEWTTLSNSLGGAAAAGGALKATGTFWWAAPNTGATNSSGFSAVANGHRFYDGTFYEPHRMAYFWTATEDPGSPATVAFYYSLSCDKVNLYKGSKIKAEGLSVRCVKD